MKRIVYIVIALLFIACGNKKETKEVKNDNAISKTEQNDNQVANGADTTKATSDGNNSKDKELSTTSKKPLSIADIKGNWILVEFERTGSDFNLNECDKQTIWQFKGINAKPMVDGTEMYKLVAKKGAECDKWFGFESAWVVYKGKLFITSSTIGGVGGISQAGVFDNAVFENDKMILTAQKSKYTFQRK